MLDIYAWRDSSFHLVLKLLHLLLEIYYIDR